jgi:hypothetical protein
MPRRKLTNKTGNHYSFLTWLELILFHNTYTFPLQDVFLGFYITSDKIRYDSSRIYFQYFSINTVGYIYYLNRAGFTTDLDTSLHTRVLCKYAAAVVQSQGALLCPLLKLYNYIRRMYVFMLTRKLWPSETGVYHCFRNNSLPLL